MSNEKSDPSLGSTSNSTPENVIQEADDLAKDVLQILDKHGVAQAVDSETLKGLMIDFSIYFVNRDHKILQHGIDVVTKIHKGHPEIVYAIKLVKEAIAEGGLSHYLEAKMQDYVENV